MDIRKFNYNDLAEVVEGLAKVIYIGTAEKFIYVDGKKSEKKEADVINVATKGLGEMSLLFPPSEKLADAMNQSYGFGDQIVVTDLGEIKDVNVSIYNNKLVFKFQMGDFRYEG